jgi:two-component system sensor histidine kinase KdpD
VHFIYGLLAVGVATICAFSMSWLLPPALFRINDQNVALLFMIACAFVAGRFGLLPGLVASVASFLTMNYYFTIPYHIIKIDTVTDYLNMVLFLSAALLISLFTSQTRDYGRKAAQREVSTQALFTLYRLASEAFTRTQALEKLQYKLENMLKVDVAFFLPVPGKGGQPESIEPVIPENLELGEADRKALTVAWSEMKTTGLASPFNPGTQWRFEPIISSIDEIGVLGVRPRGKMVLDAWFGMLLTAVADQTATVLQHIDLERSMEDTRMREEREKLRSMLLSSVSHDFKTPLAGIIGALSVHRSLGERLSLEKRDELIEAAIEEAQRLDSFITNILDMTRLESGNITFRKDWHDMQGMIDSVIKRLRHRLRKREVIVQPLPPGLEVNIDMVMMEQVLQNVLDNACKYTPADTRIDISCRIGNDKTLRCEIRDFGAGLPSENPERVFDKYARLHKKDSQVAGTGLGLAISKAIMEAQGGSITATNHPEGGALFSMLMPEWRRGKLTKRAEAKE